MSLPSKLKGKKVECLVVDDILVQHRKGIISSEIITVKMGWRKGEEQFAIDTQPLMIYTGLLKRTLKPLFVCDVRKHTTIPLNTEKVYDGKIKNQLQYLSQRKFWEALVTRLKLTFWQMMVYMLAGYGLFRFIEYIIQHIFLRV